MFEQELKLFKQGYRRIAGIDEAGRGPLAGPVMACAVVISDKKLVFKDRYLKNIKDSKKLTPQKREKWYKILTKHPQIMWAVGQVSEKTIDKINIKNAAELAMERAVKKLKLAPDFLIIDGIHLKNLKLKTYNLKLIIKADEKVFSCAAASIIAKVTRDRLMRNYHKKYLQYGFDKHKGYGTKMHLAALKKYGPCEIHRRSFRPIKIQ